MPTSPTPFGRALRSWRTLRGWSQLDLSIAADSTPRHVSFLETGRSRPSAQMVERLSEALAVPIRERNDLFEAAGLPGPFDLDSAGHGAEDWESFSFVIESVLEAHLPFPAFAFDRRWNVVYANETAEFLLGGERNLVHLMYGPTWRELILNWDAVAWSGLTRLRRDVLAAGDDPVLADLLEHAERALDNTPRPSEVGSELVVCPIFSIEGIEIPTITVVARFGSPRTVASEELQIELVFPSDDRGRSFFETIKTT